MTDVAFDRAVADPAPIQPASRPNLDKGFNPLTMILFFGILAAGLLYVAYSIYSDVDATGTRVTSYLPYVLLFVALLLPLKLTSQNRAPVATPAGHKAPPAWIRGVLIRTRRGLSFAPGSNDRQ